jgi:Cdc6-like AAA superfamily ATPase
MIEIIKSRIRSVHEQLEATGEEKIDVDDKAIELVGRKVEASNGDLRMCLSVMVEAVGATEAEWKKKKCAAAAATGDKTPFAKVTLAHVLKALTASLSKLKSNIASSSSSAGSSTSNPAVDNKVRSLPPQVRFLLLSLLIARTRIALNIRPAHAPPQNNAFASVDYSAERLTSEHLNATYQHILSGPKSPFAPVASADFGDLIMQAEVIGLISIGGGGSGPGSSGGAGSGSGSFSSMFGMTPPKASRKKSSSGAGGKGKEKVIDLLVKEEELKHALGIVREGEAVSPGAGGGGTMENEIRNIWKREEGRWLRVVENRGKSGMGKKKEVEVLGFDED